MSDRRKMIEEAAEDCLHKGGSKFSFLLGIQFADANPQTTVDDAHALKWIADQVWDNLKKDIRFKDEPGWEEFVRLAVQHVAKQARVGMVPKEEVARLTDQLHRALNAEKMFSKQADRFEAQLAVAVKALEENVDLGDDRDHVRICTVALAKIKELEGSK